jgi:hypothetical protein
MEGGGIGIGIRYRHGGLRILRIVSTGDVSFNFAIEIEIRIANGQFPRSKNKNGKTKNKKRACAFYGLWTVAGTLLLFNLFL